jgi:hypothetical protein
VCESSRERKIPDDKRLLPSAGSENGRCNGGNAGLMRSGVSAGLVGLLSDAYFSTKTGSDNFI